MTFMLKMNEHVSSMKESTEAFMDQMGEPLLTAKGNVNAARENMRLATEKGKSKINSTVLHVQGRIDQIKEDCRSSKSRA